MLTRPPGPSAIDAALFAPLLAFARIGIAVSGGPDSLALMLLVADWAREAGREIIVYTVDHRLRPEAADEAAMVAREAERLGFLCRVLAWTEPKPDSGMQAAARMARYRLIGEAMRADGVEVLVTAHHRHDQAETVLMRMAHGSGIAGLAGMTLFAEVEGVKICRPLLDVDPALLREVVRTAGLAPAADPTNLDDAYERVRWRNLLPALADEGLDGERLSAFARRMARADAALDRAAAEALARLAKYDGFGIFSLPVDDVFDLAEEIGLRVLDRIVTWAGGGKEHNRLTSLEAAFDALRGAAPGFASTLGGAAILRTGSSVQIFREAGRMPDIEPIVLTPETSFVWDGRFKFRCSRNDCQGWTVEKAGEGVTRAEVEALVGPISASMRAVAAAPALRDRGGRLAGIGALGHAFRNGVDVIMPYIDSNARQSGPKPGNQNINSPVSDLVSGGRQTYIRNSLSGASRRPPGKFDEQ